MMTTIQSEHFTQAIYSLLDETFDHVNGHYLDSGDSLFETLATITAAEASIPVGGKCATLAAQVKHVAYYLDRTVVTVLDPSAPRADWGHIWRTVSAVTPAEWQAIQVELRASYDGIKRLIANTPGWPSADHISGAIDVIAHTAYHLGEIRQALCAIRT